MGADEWSADDRPPPYSEMEAPSNHHPGAMGTFEEHQNPQPCQPPENVEFVPVAVAVPRRGPVSIAADSALVGPVTATSGGGGESGGAVVSSCLGRNFRFVAAIAAIAALVLVSVITVVAVHFTVGFSGGGAPSSESVSESEPPNDFDPFTDCQSNADSGWEWPAVLNFEGDPEKVDPYYPELGRLMKSSPENPIRVPLGRCVHIVMENYHGGIFQYQGLTPRKSWAECMMWEADTIRRPHN